MLNFNIEKSAIDRKFKTEESKKESDQQDSILNKINQVQREINSLSTSSSKDTRPANLDLSSAHDDIAALKKQVAL